MLLGPELVYFLSSPMFSNEYSIFIKDTLLKYIVIIFCVVCFGHHVFVSDLDYFCMLSRSLQWVACNYICVFEQQFLDLLKSKLVCFFQHMLL